MKLTREHKKTVIPNHTNYEYLAARQERQELQSLQFERREKMRHLQKEIIVNDMLEKFERASLCL